MSCGFDQDKLSGYYDGELDASARAEAERHISACSDCLRELGEIKSAAVLVKGLPRLKAPASIAEGVSRAVAQGAPRAGRIRSLDKTRRGLWWITGIAAAVFMAANVTFFLGEAPRSAPQTSAAPALGSSTLADQAKAEPAEAPAPRPVATLRKSAPVEEAAPGRRALEEKSRGEREAKDAAPDAGWKKAAEVPPKKAETAAAPPAAKAVPHPAPAAAAPAPGAPPPPPAAPARPAPALERAEGRNQDGLAALPRELAFCSLKLPAQRAKVEEILAKYGAEIPAINSKARAFRPEGLKSVVLSLTPRTYAAMKVELEKLGDARLVPGNPDDEVLVKCQGLEAGKADRPKAAVASGGVRAASKPSAPNVFGGKDSKEEAVERQVILHLLQVVELPKAAPSPND
jgi:anti-sigma factor RsiW